MAEVSSGADSESRDSGERGTTRVCVVGVGTVGLHELLAFAEAGHDTVGYDVDSDRISAYQDGRDPTGTVGDDRLDRCDCEFTTDPSSIGSAEYVLVTVPTATDRGEPSPGTVTEVGTTIGRHLATGATVVLVSTVPPGTTEGRFRPAIEASSGMVAGEEFFVAHAPERLSPSTDTPTVFPATRLVGAASRAVAVDVAAHFDRTVDSVRVVEDVRAVEAAKCVENVQRDVNIALVNELAGVLGEMGIDARTVLEAAGTKWNFHSYEPGLVGGKCVPVASRFLLSSAQRAGSLPRMVELARSVNDRMVSRVVDATIAALDYRARRVPDVDRDPARERRLLACGLAYKPDSHSLAATPSEPVVRRLQRHDVQVVGHDPLVDADRVSEKMGIDVLATADHATFDAVLVLVGHATFDSLSLDDLSDRLEPHPVVVDVPGVFEPPTDDANVVYRGVSDVS